MGFLLTLLRCDYRTHQPRRRLLLALSIRRLRRGVQPSCGIDIETASGAVSLGKPRLLEFWTVVIRSGEQSRVPESARNGMVVSGSIVMWQVGERSGPYWKVLLGQCEFGLGLVWCLFSQGDYREQVKWNGNGNWSRRD